MIADAAVLGPISVADAVRTMIEAGIGWIQVRMKNPPTDREFYAQVESCVECVGGSDARIWVNDRPDIATMVPAHGLHLGQQDISPAMARQLVGEHMWIGQSTHSEGQARAAHADPNVDVVAVGPIFPTSSKVDPEAVVGLECLSRIRNLTDKPIVAIGGINSSSITEVIAAGADSAVLLSDLCFGDIEMNCNRAIAAAGGGK